MKDKLKAALDDALYKHIGKLFEVRVVAMDDEDEATKRFAIGLDKAITAHEQLSRIIEATEA